MLFNSFEFCGFLMVTFAVYYLPLLRRFQVPILILASFIFYASHNPWLLLLLLGSILINAVMSSRVLIATSLREKKYGQDQA